MRMQIEIHVLNACILLIIGVVVFFTFLQYCHSNVAFNLYFDKETTLFFYKITEEVVQRFKQVI